MLRRRDGDGYRVDYDCVRAENIANKTKTVPVEMITDEKNNIKDELLLQILPLIGGEIAVPTERGLPKHFKFKK